MKLARNASHVLFCYTLKVASHIQTLTPRFVFRINNSAVQTTRNVFIRVEDEEGFAGHGEGAPSKFFGEYADELQSKLLQAGQWLRGAGVRTVADIERIWLECWGILQPFRAAQAALDIALWDLVAKREGKSVTELAFGEKPQTVKSFVTIGLSDAEELKIKVAELHGYPLIKVKMDRGVDLAALRFIREQTGATLAVDANRAWKNVDLPALSAQLAELGVIFIEQPLPVENDKRMMDILPGSKLPILADESCAVLEDVEKMTGLYSGFNIKLSKCGGLTPALKMLKRGRELGLQVMVGCRLESSLSIAAGAVIAQKTDHADLDGAWLLGDDPFSGLPLRKGELEPARDHGLGVLPVDGMFRD